jgi:hypothetical protein
MKKIAGLFIVFGFVLAAPVLKLHAQASFEGTITWSMTIPMLDDDKHGMTINVKGDKSEVNMDMGVQGNVMVYSDRSTKKTTVVMTAMKSGMTMDMNEIKTTKTDPIDMKPSGKKETIAGHPAEEYLIKGAHSDISLWVTNDLPKDIQDCFYNTLSNNPRQDANETKAMKQLVEQGYVPVRIVVKAGDETQMSMEFVKYERKSVADALFVIPSDIKISPMQKAPGGSGGGMN